MENLLNYLSNANPFCYIKEGLEHLMAHGKGQPLHQIVARQNIYGSWIQNLLITLLELLYISTRTPVGCKAVCRGSRKRRWVKVGALCYLRNGCIEENQLRWWALAWLVTE